MTVKQGEDINKQFTILKDSIVKVNESLLKAKAEFNSLTSKNKLLVNDLSDAKNIMEGNAVHIECLEKELELTQKEILSDRRFIRRQTITVGALLLGFTVLMSSLIK